MNARYIAERLGALPLLLTRGEILEELRRCNLGGRDYYDLIVSSGVLKAVPGIHGAKQARYATADFFHDVVAPALGVTVNSRQD